MMKTWKKAIAISTLAIVAIPATHAASDKKDEFLEKRFKEADLNGNGVITHEEMMQGVQKKFAKFDKNGDGYLTLAELPKEMPVPDHVQERMKKRMERMKERAEEAERDFDPEDMPPMGHKGKPSRLHFVAKHDKDGDERVSLEEFARKAVKHFKRGDINGDGEVTLDEAKEAMEHRHKGKHGKKFPKPGHGR
ncbi:MAG: EF-hand domain-containing protein [Alphaproteobacteria bacterium]|nr:EF-hand domain-containing protein [Alphaproteobacteria bacterium]